jgi:hypothetical protein
VSIFLTLPAQVATFVIASLSNDSSLPLGLGGCRKPTYQQ